ncbi:hypothetical protein BT63DRAFT_371538 [Microthyrium microscopicum]|uniref:Coatomer subunit epsilon n=1 Tax=Microthyrium microscopicum TaxID=703497 RepID=A0A6A6UGF6_9PEZI|nr:hypothetical protein BT63DRAFT_371538 [Microthyrium microscopicum]
MSDPYSADGELALIHNAFHQGQYQNVVDWDSSSFSSEYTLPAHLLQLRARLALHQYDEVASEAKGKSQPDYAAAAIAAEYFKKPSESSPALAKAEKLAESQGENMNVEILCGTVLASAGKVDEALALLAKHQGSLDVVAVIVQIELSRNRLDLAKKAATAARKWAQDNLLVNIAESWIGMREGGEKYQAAYYVFEELAQAEATQSVQSLTSQAISELHLGRLQESEAAFEQAQGLDADNADVLANLIVLNTIAGKDVAEQKKALQKSNPNHQLLLDLAEKKSEFDKAAERWTPKVKA